MASLRLSYLGPPRIELDGATFQIRRRLNTALLAYLAVSGERQMRESLTALLWPESDNDSARAALRRNLSELNRALGGGRLDVDRSTVALRPGYWLDVAELRAISTKQDADIDSLIAATALYQDDFLAGFTLPASPQFDEWQYFQAENLRLTLASCLERLVTLLEDGRDYHRATPFAKRWLALDASNENANYRLIHLLALSGQRGAAARHYEAYCRLLHDEFSAAPSDRLARLHKELQSGRLQPVAAPARKSRLSALPVQTTLFIGRERELADVQRLLLSEPDCRLLSLIGPGGIGKTRLALAAAARVAGAFPDGAAFVPLASVGEAAYVVTAIAEALRLQLFGNVPPRAQLLDHLHTKEMLLVVDNYEHLLEEAGLLSEIVAAAPGVTLLTTSRERLNVREEWVYDVWGLDYPPPAVDVVTDAAEYSAVDLFIQRARQSHAHFTPTQEDLAGVVRICRLVEGMPLALELAAPWVRTLCCRQIAEEIEAGLDVLSTRLRNLEERHRSITAVFEQTWRGLPDGEKATMQRLSVFRGGCTRAAAEAVAGATPAVLSSLIDKALLRRTNTGRYELHELVRQFADRQLKNDPAIYQETQKRHREYFVRYLEEREMRVKGHAQAQALTELEADVDNVRLAWRGAVAGRDFVALARCAECLFVYYLYRNGYDEGIREFGRAVSAWAPVKQDDPGFDAAVRGLGIPPQDVALFTFCLSCLGYFVAHRRDLHRGQRLLEIALDLVRREAPNARRQEAVATLWLAWAHYFRGHRGKGKALGEQSLRLFTVLTEPWGAAWALQVIGNCLRDGRPAEAEPEYRKAAAVSAEAGDHTLLSYASFNLGAALALLGRYPEAQQHIDHGVAISEDQQNELGIGYALLRRGQLEILRGDYGQAVESLRTSWTRFNRVGTVHASLAQLYLARAHHQQRRYSLAQQLYEQALDGLNAAESRLEYTSCLDGLGSLATDLGDLDHAEQLHRQSLALLHDTEPEPALVANALRCLGRAVVAAGDERSDEARSHFQCALQLATDNHNCPIVLDLFVDIAGLMAQDGNVIRAVEILYLAEQHQAATSDTRERARARRLDLARQLPLDILRALHVSVEDADPLAVARALLVELPDPGQ